MNTTWIFDQRNYTEKEAWKRSEFWTITITPKEVNGNDLNFSISDITLKKCVEMTWKFVKIWSSMYRHNIHLESTLIRRGVSVGSFIL